MKTYDFRYFVVTKNIICGDLKLLRRYIIIIYYSLIIFYRYKKHLCRLVLRYYLLNKFYSTNLFT